MTHYPNREHMNADAAARRRARAAITSLEAEADALSIRLDTFGVPEPEETARLHEAAMKVTRHVAELATLRDVREWDAADRAEVEAAVAETRRGPCICKGRKGHTDPACPWYGTDSP